MRAEHNILIIALVMLLSNRSLVKLRATSICGLLSILCAHAAQAHNCIPTLLSVQSVRQTGPTCLVAAASTAASRLDVSLPFPDLVRHVPVYPDGIHAYDLVPKSNDAGSRQLRFRRRPRGLLAWSKQDLQISMRKNAGSKHAVTVTGARRAIQKGHCTKRLDALRIYDSATGKTKWLTPQQFEAKQVAAQQIVIFEPSNESKLGKRVSPCTSPNCSITGLCRQPSSEKPQRIRL